MLSAVGKCTLAIGCTLPSSQLSSTPHHLWLTGMSYRPAWTLAAHSGLLGITILMWPQWYIVYLYKNVMWLCHYDSHVISVLHHVDSAIYHVTSVLHHVTSVIHSCIFTKICHVTLSCQWYSTWRSTGHVIMWWGHTGSDAHKQPLQQPGIVASGYKR